MELRQAILRRRMVRAFQDWPVDPAVVDRLLEHATHAPSAGFSQGWAFLVLTEPADRTRFWDAVFPDRTAAFTHHGIFGAGCLIVPLGEGEAHEAGRLLGMAGMADVVDAVVVTVALRNKAVILTSDMDDIERLVTAAGGAVAVAAF